MAVLEIRLYPDPVLKRRAELVGTPTAADIGLADDLVETMRTFNRCVGIAANQVGVLRQLIIVDVTGHAKADSCSGLLVLFDPKIVSHVGDEIGREGCLSLPDLTANVRRATEIVVSATESGGANRVVEANAFEARALQHEIDHLNGLLFLDRVADLGTDVFTRKRS